MRSVSDRFWVKVAGGSCDECWQWSAALNAYGYGAFWDGSHVVAAHRWAYEYLRSEIPGDLHLDHLCRNRACVNPWHLEPVTNKVNAERGAWGMRTHCPVGHPYDDSNTGRRRTRDGRECITCRRAAHDKRREDNRARLLADPTAAEHGTLTTYTDWMCRCQRCRDAHAAYRRDQRARSIGRAS